MAVTFSSAGCREAASNLNSSAKNIDRILNVDLNSTINSVRQIYSSATADELYASYDKVKNEFPSFLAAVTNCSEYLENTVAVQYEKLENQAADRIN